MPDILFSHEFCVELVASNFEQEAHILLQLGEIIRVAEEYEDV